MNLPLRHVDFSEDSLQRQQQLVSREWLVTAGNGSYAMGSLGFVPTRRHHGLLVANLPAPLGRTMSLIQLREEVVGADGEVIGRLWGKESVEHGLQIHGDSALENFRLEGGLPVWQYRIGSLAIEKALMLPHGSSTVCVRYRLDSGSDPSETLTLRLRPMVQFRGHNDSVDTPCEASCRSVELDRSYEVSAERCATPLRIRFNGCEPSYVCDPVSDPGCFYRVEQSRGYDHMGTLHSDGFFNLDVAKATEILVTASMDPWDDVDRLLTSDVFETERHRRLSLLEQATSCKIDSQTFDDVTSELILAADQFVIAPAPRQADRPDSDPRTEEPVRRSIIAGYPWFTDWGRDTMISLPGLTLATGRFDDAKSILLTFADYVRDGLIPNLFPEGGQEGMYHTADATLWFFQAIAEYQRATGDDELVQQLLPKLSQIVDAHRTGTRFGIRVDPSDGLLIQGEEGVQLTWMDAKAGDWVVTPRRGKAVEINALWYNAIKLHSEWLRQFGSSDQLDSIGDQVDQTYRSFNERFWFAEGNHLFDIVDGECGDDASLRPNQLFALSLTHPVLGRKHWDDVIDSCVEHLLTPLGLRSLAMSSPDYHGVYHGDVVKRDAAYHQGTVWSWLIGPMVRAWCRANPDRGDVAADWLVGLEEHLGESCIGQLSEIFEGNAPHAAKGCNAQAWSIGEMLIAKQLVARQSANNA
jgi:predicted glycogen debranching enzyme